MATRSLGLFYVFFVFLAARDVSTHTQDFDFEIPFNPILFCQKSATEVPRATAVLRAAFARARWLYSRRSGCNWCVWSPWRPLVLFISERRDLSVGRSTEIAPVSGNTIIVPSLTLIKKEGEKTHDEITLLDDMQQ